MEAIRVYHALRFSSWRRFGSTPEVGSELGACRRPKRGHWIFARNATKEHNWNKKFIVQTELVNVDRREN